MKAALVWSISMLMWGHNINTMVHSWMQTVRLIRQRRGASRLFVSSAFQDHFVSVEDCLSDPAIRFIDGSWYHKGSKSGRYDFENVARIRNADYFDLDDISASNRDLYPDNNNNNTKNDLSHMLPPPRLFAAYMDALGISETDPLVIYGQADCSFLPRIWFTFKVMGHDHVRLMDGSLRDWQVQGGSTECDPKKVIAAKDLDLTKRPSYQTRYRDEWVIELDTLRNNLDQCTVLDPRGSSFWYGHMPNAIHIPYSSLHRPGEPTRVKSLKELEQLVLEKTRTTKHDSVVVSCGSGVSACNLYLVLDILGKSARLYDGSWQEWSLHEDTPKVIPQQQKTSR